MTEKNTVNVSIMYALHNKDQLVTRYKLVFLWGKLIKELCIFVSFSSLPIVIFPLRV